MLKKKFKKYQLNSLKDIQNISNQIYIYRYNDLKINEIILLKKKLKLLNYKLIIFKKRLLINSLFNFNGQGQGSIFIIYNIKSMKILPLLNTFKKTDLITLIINNKIISPIKLEKILSTKKKMNIILMQKIFVFLIVLKQLNLANIT